MSSLYGMAELDVRGFKEKCVEAGLSDVLLYIGGILGVGRHDFKEDEVKFKKLGIRPGLPAGGGSPKALSGTSGTTCRQRGRIAL